MNKRHYHCVRFTVKKSEFKAVYIFDKLKKCERNRLMMKLRNICVVHVFFFGLVSVTGQDILSSICSVEEPGLCLSVDRETELLSLSTEPEEFSLDFQRSISAGESYAFSVIELCVNSTFCLEDFTDEDFPFFTTDLENIEDFVLLATVKDSVQYFAIKARINNICVSVEDSIVKTTECNNFDDLTNYPEILFTLEEDLDFELRTGSENDEDPLCFRCPDRWPRGTKILYRSFQSFLFLGLISACCCYFKKVGEKPLWIEDGMSYIRVNILRKGMTEKEMKALRLENLGRETL
eukprot:snap_masked-scaffold_18-processed-gene-6.55-mRNA-1 protein AED:1.00 eAED:1.00 QI:0/0/0/0/1/1/2/0/292